MSYELLVIGYWLLVIGLRKMVKNNKQQLTTNK